jgi:hypothetical protein
VVALFQQGARIFVCGDARTVMAGVRQTAALLPGGGPLHDRRRRALGRGAGTCDSWRADGGRRCRDRRTYLTSSADNYDRLPEDQIRPRRIGPSVRLGGPVPTDRAVRVIRARP